jgi:3-ketoacyl-CoA synthase
VVVSLCTAAVRSLLCCVCGCTVEDKTQGWRRRRVPSFTMLVENSSASHVEAAGVLGDVIIKDERLDGCISSASTWLIAHLKALGSLPKDLGCLALVPLLLVGGSQLLSLLLSDKFLGIVSQLVYWFSSSVELFADSTSFGTSSSRAAVLGSLLLALALMQLLFLTLKKLLDYQRTPTYLLDLALFKPDDSCKVAKDEYLVRAKKTGFFLESSIEFQKKVLDLSALGDETYAPPSMLTYPIDTSQAAADKDADIAMFAVVDQIFATGIVKPEDVGILVVTCTVFCPVPSLASRVVNRYKLREDIEAYSLGGMGCSTGVLSISLCRDLLKVNKNTHALAVNLEVISGQQGYRGNKRRSMMVTNCLFRWGAAAILLSNKPGDKKKAKYQLMHVVRTHRGADDKSFKCVRSEEDEDGFKGLTLSKDIVPASAVALKNNVTKVAPLILPFTEKLKYVINLIARKVLKMQSMKAYIPDFKSGVDHFCIHPGGKAVIDGMMEHLKLSEWHIEPSRMTLHRWGNTSCSSIWYVMAYMEAKNRVGKGHILWQLALGSGFKCNTAIWKSLRNNQNGPSPNPWLDCIDKYPQPVWTNLPPPSTTKESNNPA